MELLDSIIMVTPILPYGSEIWRIASTGLIEKLRLTYCRTVLHVSKSTAKRMLYRELGWYPMQVYINQRMVCYRPKTVNSKDDKMNKKLYQITLQLCKRDELQSEWILRTKQCLNNWKMYHRWIHQRLNVCHKP